MRTWVTYSVTVYLGLLLAGSIASPMPKGIAPNPGLRASYRTTLPRSAPKPDPASNQDGKVIGDRGPGIAWQSSARAGAYHR